MSRMVIAVPRPITVFGLAALALWISAPPAPASPRVLVQTMCPSRAYRPRAIYYACPSARRRVSSLRWAEWTAARARGEGVDTFPRCRDRSRARCRRFRRVPAQVTLTRPRYCPGIERTLFTRLRLVHTAAGAPRPGFTVRLSCPQVAHSTRYTLSKS